ncbi:hypothetical protein OIDMADRAFT_48889 [Oidiodendron maius Zn]|uniref:Uncharacterized protein n=1 Tax=Oidiodendron maius (strain Zn) TaxID=913774 RepID=A0A0C3DCG9_OIDMZ|nr:hypothetical protein OIDMADRAFT_48889 [Oidiodendron maius Zn]
MGGIMGNTTLPYPLLIGLSMTIFGNFIYQPDDWVDIVAKFPLENWEEAWSTAAEKAGPRDFTIIEPQA